MINGWADRGRYAVLWLLLAAEAVKALPRTVARWSLGRGGPSLAMLAMVVSAIGGAR